jgi:hypothetical protein
MQPIGCPVGFIKERTCLAMSSTSFFFRRAALLTIATLSAFVAGSNCYAVISFRLPQVQVTPAPTGPTTGSFNVVVSAAPADLPKLIGSFNVDFSVANTLVKLGPASVPAVNPLLPDPGTPQDPLFIDFSTTDQKIQVGQDVGTGAFQPLADGKAVVTVPFSVPAGLTGTFPLQFSVGSPFNTLVDNTGNPLPLSLTNGQISVMATPAGLPGDYNNNGTVDAADYVVWRNNLGQSVTLPNEVSGTSPGTVTQADYDAWRARFGRTTGSGASALVAGAVPEPAALVLFLFVSILLALARRNRP